MLLFSAITFGQVGFSQTFNAATTLPAGWTTNRHFGTATQACNGNSFRSNLYTGATTTTANLGTPNFVGQSNGTDLSVSFDYKVVNYFAATVATPAGWGNAQLQYSANNGTTWTTAPMGTINDANHTVANTCATFSVVISGASLPNGTDVKLRILNTWASGDYYFYIDNFSGSQVAANPPNCSTLTVPLNGATNVNEESNLTWSAATGVPTGYFLSVGTTPGGTEIVNNFDNGNSTSYNLPSLTFGATYYVRIIPYNANGNATGCTEESFTVRAAPPAGQICGNPLIVGALPYNTVDNTNIYVDDYNGSPGASGCGSTNAYLNGDDVVYAYTATSDATINFALSSIGSTYAGMFLYNSCGDIGTSCIAGATNLNATTDLDFDYNVINGQTYYVVISTWATPQSTAYTLDIREVLCADPSALTATNITTTTADLSWTDNGGTATPNWNIEILPAGNTPTNTATNTATTNSFPATGLTANTSYDYYVQANCGAGALSLWVGPFTFTTACNTFTAPYTEDFENAGVVPDCWTLAGGDDWDFNLTGPNHVGNGGTITGSTTSGNYYAVVDDSGATTNVSVLESPFVDLTPLTTPALTFFEISDNETNANATLTVEVWDGAAWNTVGTYNTNTAGWELKTINLSSLTFTGPAQVRFSVADSGSFYDDIAIDDVSFVELPTCPQPSTLTVTNITATTADLGWTEAGTATSWDIEIVDITAGGTFTGTPTATGVANPYTVTGLLPQNDYAFYVRADCGGDLSAYSGPSNFRTACAPITTYPSTTDFTNNPPTTCWNEAGDGEVAAGPSGLGASDWRGNRAYEDSGANVINSNALNLYQSVDREWLLSPIYTIPSGTPHGLKVQVAVTNWTGTGTTTTGDTMGSDDEVRLLMTTDNGATWSTLTTWNVGNQPDVNGTDYLADLTAVSGDVQFALWGSDGTVDDGEDYDFHVGAFTVDLLSTLGTEEFKANNLDFSYYPNPVSNELTINAATKVSSVSVINVLGQTVYNAKPNTKKVLVNMRELKAGYYFVQVISGDSSRTIKVIKN